jgi:hypothetical protein
VREKNAFVVGGLVLLLLLLPLGALVHVDAQFPGSLAGSLIGITGAVLMLVPFAYLVIKRTPALHDRVTRHVSMRTLLAIHIYAGVLGPLLGLIHAAHTFNSPLGVSLTGLMLVVVVSGYIGRYLLSQISRALRGRRSDLAALQAALPALPADVPASPMASFLGWSRRLLERDAPVLAGDAPISRRRVAGAIADFEFAVRAEAVVQTLFDAWLKMHIVIAMVLYALLALHIWSGLCYGPRWP